MITPLHIPPPTPNVPALRKAVEFAETSHAQYGWDPIEWIDEDTPPDTAWYQPRYSTLLRHPTRQAVRSGEATLQTCGTAYCIAGYTVSQLPGYRAEVALDRHGEHPVLKETLDGCLLTDITIYEAARDELGLTLDQAMRLFDADNSVKNVRRIAEEIAGERL